LADLGPSWTTAVCPAHAIEEQKAGQESGQE